MKNRVVLLLVLVVTIIMASVTIGYAATISEKAIKEGLKACEEYPVYLRYGGKEIQFKKSDVPPVIITADGEKNGRTLIPARALFEEAGATVEWVEATQSVIIEYDKIEIVLNIGKSTAYVDGKKKSLDIPPLIIDHDGDYYGSTMIPVRFVAENLGMTVSWNEVTRVISVSKKITKIVSEDKDNEDSKIMDTDTVKVPSRIYDGKDINTSDLPKVSRNAKNKVIVIDAGHGGKDSGAVGHSGLEDELYEKDVNLAVALNLKEYLEEAGLTNINLTRDDDTYITLADRATFANELNADFFISIHNNAATATSANGSEVYYYSKVYKTEIDKSEQDESEESLEGETIEDISENIIEENTEKDIYGIASKDVAALVEAELIDYLDTRDRGYREYSSLAVLNKTEMPAILVEGAFLSNEDDFSQIKKADFAKKYAFACAVGIVKAFNEAF